MLFDSAPSKERLFLFMGAVSGFLAVALGAFGEHALWERLSSDRLAIFETAARYQMFHSLALVMTGMVVTRRIGRAAPAAGWLFAAGIVLFCGSLYLLALSGARWWGAVTPLGGLSWLAAWVLLAFSGARGRMQVAAVEEPRIEGPGD
jgi:uncharacterized membrane protein YgdD (TMEM256/DUF423 family)